MPRGGKRQGRTGALYGNRSDLQTGARLPVQAAPGQGYGVRKQQEDAQRVVPLRRAGLPAGAPPAAQAAPVPAPPAPPGPLDAPTANPGEPLTAGSAYGAGPGPEAVTFGAPQRMSELLGRLPATGDLADLRVFARQRGL